jgi:hypothetical protein
MYIFEISMKIEKTDFFYTPYDLTKEKILSSNSRAKVSDPVSDPDWALVCLGSGSET